MGKFLIYLITFAGCLTVAILAVFFLSCWWGAIALFLSLFLAERAGLLK